MDAPQHNGDEWVLMHERVVIGGLAGVRDMIADRATRLGLPSQAVGRFVLAVHEAVTNAIEHANGAGEVTVWHDGETLIAEVRDEGPGLDWVRSTLPPPAEALHGRGLWLINQLVDHVRVVSTPAGAVVRLEVLCTTDGGR
jgi:serine/threonine-protein kinase RsbW